MRLEGFGGNPSASLRIIRFFLTPIVVGIMVLRELLVWIVYERRLSDAVATRETAFALLVFSLGIAVFAVRNVVSRAFLTLQDTRIPIIIGLVTVGLNIVLDQLSVGSRE